MPFFRHLSNQVSFSQQQRVATPLYQSDPLTVMLVGFEPGQSIAEHPGPAGAFYVINGDGWISIDGERQRVQAGTVAIAPHGARRGVEASSRLTLLVSRGEEV